MDKAGREELLRRARRRDPAALGELVEIYSGRVFGLLYRMTGAREVAEDLMQETFLRVVRVIEQYEHVGKFEPWLFRIAANLARDWARQRSRRGEAGPLADGWGDIGAPGATASRSDPAEELARGEAGHHLMACLDRLSPGEREVILLRHFSELSFREIAELLDIPLGTALARAHRALKRLRRELTDDDEG